MDQDVEEMHDLLSSEPEKAQELMEQLSEWEQTCCKDPLWIEEGWAEITNGLHERLMKNEIRTGTGSLDKKKPRYKVEAFFMDKLYLCNHKREKI